MTAAIFLLVVIGLVVIYSATFTAKTLVEGVGTLNRQLVFVVLGFVIYFAVSFVDPEYFRYRPIQIAIFVVTVGLLLYVWLFGNPVHGTNRWIEWGFIRIQPSEFTKIALILLNSGILVNALKKNPKDEVDWGRNEESKNLKEKIVYFFKNISAYSPLISTYGLAIFISVICCMLILVEPAIGNASITVIICAALFLVTFPKQKILLGFFLTGLLSANIFARFVTFAPLYEKIGVSLFVSGFDLGVIVVSLILMVIFIFTLRMKLVHIIAAILVGTALTLTVSFAWENYLSRNRRIVTFLNPEEDPSGAGWQLLQSKIAIGSGRLIGKGFLQGSQSKLRYLPEAYNDFIFAALCEEFGLLGAVVLFALYVFLILRIIHAAKGASKNYEALICFGVAIMLIVHITINTGMNMGILPITGIPLPLISYGGSSVVVTMIALGLVQAVNVNKDVVDMQEGLMIRS